MRLTTLLMVGAGLGGGYVLARRLLDDEHFADTLPEQLRPQALQTRQRLLRARARAAEAWREADEERARAERELLIQYEHRSGRTVGTDRPMPPRDT
ncbi:MAG: hypothetical protein GEU80_16545 [Dehalococcoidia bacterium]|nr:hypothetical protein [Dehalococcoidia bacterium]